jgi:hypothetical protein
LEVFLQRNGIFYVLHHNFRIFSQIWRIWIADSGWMIMSSIFIWGLLKVRSCCELTIFSVSCAIII